MEELIKTYEDEISLGKKSMVNFALKDAVAYNVASAKVETYQRIVEDLKQLPEPPTVRPMSELPELNEDIHVLIEHEGQRFWTKGFICIGRVELRYLDQDCWANRDFVSKEGVKALKWLPFRELPNPNDIKL